MVADGRPSQNLPFSWTTPQDRWRLLLWLPVPSLGQEYSSANMRWQRRRLLLLVSGSQLNWERIRRSTVKDYINYLCLLPAYQFILTQPVGKEYSPDRRRILSPCCNLHFALTSKFIIESKLQQSSGSMCIGIFSGEHLIKNSLWTVDNSNIIVTTRDTSFSNMLNQRLTTSDRCILSGRVEI